MQTCPRCKRRTVSTQPVDVAEGDRTRVAWVCETCRAALTGSFFSDRPVCEMAACPFGHPIPPENSRRVGWLRCPTCLATTALSNYRAAARRASPRKIEQLRLPL